MSAQPDIARFGAAIVRDAEETYADENCARYRVQGSLDELRGFYQAIYGQRRGIILDDLPVPEPLPRQKPTAQPGFTVVASPKLQDAEWSMIVVQKAPEKDAPRAFDVLVVARGDDDLGGYADPSPWMTLGR